MTKEQLLSNKTKLEKGVNNPHLTNAQKELAKKRLAEIEAKIGAYADASRSSADLKKEEETEPQPTKESEATEEPGTPEAVANPMLTSSTGSQQRSEPAKKSGAYAHASSSSDKPMAKKKPKQHKEAFKSDCNETVAQIRLLLDGHNKKKVAKPAKPATKKRTSEVLADGFSAVFVRAVKRELTLDKVGKIKLAKLREARDKIVECLEAVRIGLGGISRENEGFIEDFKTEVNKIFDQVEERQKKAEETRQAA